MNPKLFMLVIGGLALALVVRLIMFNLSVKPYSPGTIITFNTQLLNEPELTSRGQKFSVFMPNSQRVSITSRLSNYFMYGDVVQIKGKVEYFEVEKGRKIAFMTYPEVSVLAKAEDSWIYSLRRHMKEFFNANLGMKEASLMLGITFGIKEEMPVKFEAQLQQAGLMHVIAASGMNITMLGGFLSTVFVLFMRRQTALIASIIGIILYAGLAGFEPSIVRASVMGILVFGASILGRQSTAFMTLFGAGFGMLMISPSLIYDVGFQLSFMATAGLVYLRPVFLLNSRLKQGIERTVIGEDLATTLTAQASTLPILLTNFGTYSVWSILVNAIVLWTVPFIMIIGGMAGVLSLIFEPFARLVVYLSIPFLLYFTKIAEFFGSIQGQIMISSVPILLIGGYYLILLAVILWMRSKS